MNNHKHSDGPWKDHVDTVGGNPDIAIIAPEWGIVADVGGGPLETREANAALMAAAPDADRILRYLLEYCEAGEQQVYFHSLMPDDDYDGATDEQTLGDAIRNYFAKIQGK